MKCIDAPTDKTSFEPPRLFEKKRSHHRRLAPSDRFEHRSQTATQPFARKLFQKSTVSSATMTLLGPQQLHQPFRNIGLEGRGMCAPFELAENMSEQREPLSVSRATSIPLMRKLHERSDSSQAIRSRLLTRLGIEKETVVSAVSARTEVSRVVQKGQEEAYNVALKADHGRPDRCLEEKNTIEALATSPGAVDCVLEKQANRGSVCFDASVKVHPIPARSDYSQRMRSVLWVPQIEIQQNVARNTLEFAAEEWDISKVVDDEDMIMYGGELVHPIHFVQECDMNQHFSNIIAHQQQEEKVER